MSRGNIDAIQVIRLIVTEGLNTLDQIAFNAFHTFL